MVLNLGYAILLVTIIHDIRSKIYCTPLIIENGAPITHETWLTGYESTFKLKQVRAFMETVHKYMREPTKNHLMFFKEY